MARKREEPAGVGDNSAQILGGESLKQLRALTERIMDLFDSRDALNSDISAVFKEAGESGFDKKVLRATIQRKRRMDKDEAAFKANEEQMQAYFDALWQPDLPFERLNPHIHEAKAAEAADAGESSPNTSAA